MTIIRLIEMSYYKKPRHYKDPYRSKYIRVPKWLVGLLVLVIACAVLYYFNIIPHGIFSELGSKSKCVGEVKNQLSIIEKKGVFETHAGIVESKTFRDSSILSYLDQWDNGLNSGDIERAKKDWDLIPKEQVTGSIYAHVVVVEIENSMFEGLTYVVPVVCNATGSLMPHSKSLLDF